VILGTIAVAVALVEGPVHLQWTASQMRAAGLDADHVRDGLAVMTWTGTAAVVLVPALLILRWVLFALPMWLAAEVILGPLDFQKGVSLVAFAYVPLCLRDVVTCAVLLLRDPETLRQAGGLNVPVGINLLLPHVPAPWSVLVANLNPFEAWFVVLLMTGLSKATSSDWKRSLIVVMTAWSIAVLVQFGLASLGHSLQSTS
jgi:hypothetical protein